jgi:hypothetical protein
MKIYIVKTNEEMVKEFGENWRKADVKWKASKEIILGQRIPNHCIGSSRTDPNRIVARFRMFGLSLNGIFSNSEACQWLLPKYMIKEVEYVEVQN